MADKLATHHLELTKEGVALAQKLSEAGHSKDALCRALKVRAQNSRTFPRVNRASKD